MTRAEARENLIRVLSRRGSWDDLPGDQWLGYHSELLIEELADALIDEVVDPLLRDSGGEEPFRLSGLLPPWMRNLN